MTARWVEDREGMIQIALMLAPVVEGIAQEMADEIRESPLTPREDGDYAESWTGGRARLDRDKTSISAIAYSRYRPPGARAPLGVILEYGAAHDDGTIVPPKAHIHPAAEAVSDRVRRRRMRIG